MGSVCAYFTIERYKTPIRVSPVASNTASVFCYTCTGWVICESTVELHLVGLNEIRRSGRLSHTVQRYAAKLVKATTCITTRTCGNTQLMHVAIVGYNFRSRMRPPTQMTEAQQPRLPPRLKK